MARQMSPLIKLKGTISDISFYKTADGFLAREKTGITAERFKTDPAFRNTRLNSLEFGKAGKAGKVFRSAWLNQMSKVVDNRIISRVTGLMFQVIQSDPTHKVGQRTAASGNLAFLENFQFNQGIPLDTVLKTIPVPTIDRVTGLATVGIPAYSPLTVIGIPDGATHYKIFAAAAEIDFVSGTTNTVAATTAELLWDNNPAPTVNLQMQLPANSTKPIFLVLGIEFMKIVLGEILPVSAGQNALQLVKVLAA